MRTPSSKKTILNQLAFGCTAIGTSLLFSQSALAQKPAQKEITATFSDEKSAETVLKVANAVADWQLANPYKRVDTDWTEGALWTGLTNHAETSGDDKYIQAMLDVSKGVDYKLGPRTHFGDDHCVGRLHIWNYLRDELPKQLAPTKNTLDHFLSIPHTESLEWINHVHFRELAWCDALYMTPPTIAALHAATGDPKYLEKTDELWWKSSDYLYDTKSSLFYRDSKYFPPTKEANGEKVFWSRGNGWVFSGLCHVLQHMPADHPTRGKYIQQFKEMAAKLKSIQMPDGSWRASLLDPESFPVPESSGTAFFAYGFLWGINNGILDAADYEASAYKAWDRLVYCVHPDGKLGFVQPVGENPKSVTYDQTAVYGVGAFLLTAHELHKHLILQDAKIAEFTAVNSDSHVRLNETVEIPWSTITKKLPGTEADDIAIRDTIRGYFHQTQIIDANKDGTPESLLFTADFTPSETRTFQLVELNEARPNFPKNRLEARFVPERKDDFLWENDRIAFRAYGPALAAENARGGFDAWTKSVRRPIANAWYKSGDYHKDHGTGLDGYKVGDTLGAGGLGYLDSDQKLITSPVFSTYEVLEKGPVRLKFRLSYAPVKVDGAEITETRIVTMENGDHHFTVDSSFKIKGDASKVKPVAGLAVRKDKAKPTAFTGSLLAYADPVMKKDGIITTFILNEPSAQNDYIAKKKDLLKVLANDLSKPVRYHAGAIWNKVESTNESTRSQEVELQIYLTNHALTHPIKVN